MSNSNRQVEFDILKGIGILFVILGHSVPDFPVNLRADGLSRTMEEIVYAFHMPLFFICAGGVLQMTELQRVGGGGGYKSFLKKKWFRLVLPYLCFSLLSLLLRFVFTAFTRSDVDFLNGIYGIVFEGKYYWFLYVMFFVLAIIELLRQLRVKSRYIWAMAVVLYVIGLLTGTKFLCLNKLGYYFIFTMLGMIAYKYKAIIDKWLSRWYIVFIICVLFAVLFMCRNSEFLLFRELCRFAMAISGTAVIYSLCLLIKNGQTGLVKVFSYLGIFSLPFYLVHMINQLPVYYLVAKFNLPVPILSVLAIFMITTTLTYIMVAVMNKIPLCRCMMGMPRQK